MASSTLPLIVVQCCIAVSVLYVNVKGYWQLMLV
jgi:hypothetical protein